MADKILNLIVRFLVDRGSQSDAQRAVSQIEGSTGTGGAATSSGPTQGTYSYVNGRLRDNTTGQFVSPESIGLAQRVQGALPGTGGYGAGQVGVGSPWQPVPNLPQAAVAPSGAGGYAQAGLFEQQAAAVQGVTAAYQANIATGQTVVQISQSLGMTVAETAKAWQGMTAVGGKTEQQLLADAAAFRATGQAAGTAEGDIGKADKAMGSLNKNTEGWRKNVALGITGFTLSMTGKQLELLSKAMLSPIDAYIKYSGTASEVSAKWLDAQNKITLSTVKMGEGLAEVALPTLEKVADLMSGLANFVQANPVLAAGITIAAGGLMVVGTLGVLLGQMMAGFAAIRNLYGLITSAQWFISLAGTMTGSAATAAATLEASAVIAGSTLEASALVAGASLGVGGATAGGEVAVGGAVATVTAGTVLLGILKTVGLGILEFAARFGPLLAMLAGSEISKAFGNMSLGEFLGKDIALVAGDVWTVLTGSSEKGRQAVIDVARALGVLGDTAENATPNLQAVDAYIKYQQQETDATQKYEADRLKIITDTEKSIADATATYEKDRAKLISDAATSLAEDEAARKNTSTSTARDNYDKENQYEQDYYLARSKLIRDHGIDDARSEEDHLQKLTDLRNDYQLDAEGLLDKQDAFGLLSRTRQYEKSRSQEEQSYNKEISRRDEDLALRLSDDEAAFALDRGRRLAQQQQNLVDDEVAYQAKRALDVIHLAAQLKELDQQHQDDLKKIAVDEVDKLKVLDDNNLQEKTKRQSAFADQLRDLDAGLLGERDRKNQWYAAMASDLDAWIKTWGGQVGSLKPGYIPSKLSGGYVSAGLYNLHSNEYVMDPGLVQFAEAAAGGRLTSASLKNLISGRTMGGNISVQQNLRFSGEIGAADKRSVQKIAREASISGLVEALGG